MIQKNHVMKGRDTAFLLGLLAVLFSGCATGSKSADYWRTAPPLAKGQGRIWIYWPGASWRKSEFNIQLNYASIGASQEGRAFYLDRPPGNYLVEASQIGQTKCYAKLFAGEELYVRMTRIPGL